MLAEYLPKKQRQLKKNEIPRALVNEFRRFFTLSKKLIIFYNKMPREPSRPFPETNTPFTKEQRQQCLEMFERAEQRVDKLEKKAATLFKTVSVLVPLFLAATTYLWEHSANRTFFLIISGIGLLFLFGAVIASFRTNDIKTLQAPGLQSLIDTDADQIYKYDRQRDAFGLLYCAQMNNAVSDLRADFLIIGQMFVNLSLVMLFILALSSPLFLDISNKPKTNDNLVEVSNKLAEATVSLNKAMHILELKYLQLDAGYVQANTGNYSSCPNSLPIESPVCDESQESNISRSQFERNP